MIQMFNEFLTRAVDSQDTPDKPRGSPNSTRVHDLETAKAKLQQLGRKYVSELQVGCHAFTKRGLVLQQRAVFAPGTDSSQAPQRMGQRLSELGTKPFVIVWGEICQRCS